MDIYTNEIKELLDEVNTDETENIEKACKIMYEAMREDKVVHVFATGHSHMFGEELFYRAGGLVQINPILEPFLMQHEGAVRSTKYERLSGISEIIYNSLNLEENEPFIIVSNSGINSVPIEMARLANRDGRKVIGITSKNVSKELPSRDIEGKHLYELCDVVIDNHSPMGDGIIKSKYGSIGASSTILNSYIAQRLVLGIIDMYEKDGLVPPIYMSANIKGGDEHNKELYKKFQKRIKPLC